LFRSVTTNDCKHLIIDAGHISIESDLADKDSIRTIYSKRNQKYTDEDYHYLESLMYDKMSLKLDAAQVIAWSIVLLLFSAEPLLVHCW
jgi:vacuolar protein sorting-associated protein 13A/C